MRQLHPAATDVGMIGDPELELRVGSDGRAGLRHDRAVDLHLAGEDEAARALTRCRESSFHQRHVEPGLGFGSGHVGRSVFSVDDPLGNRREPALREARIDQRLLGAGDAVAGQRAGSIEAEQ
jgi:hypothetical protein